MAPRLAHFELRERIGLGAMGAVYRAEDSRLGRTVAIKILLPEVNEDVERRSRFLREARAAAGLNHPNIGVIFEVGEAHFDEQMLIELGLYGAGSKPPTRGADELPFFAMEHVPGEDLGTLMQREGPLEIDLLADLARQIARALEAAHTAGIVHRDLKPANVRVTPEGRVKLLDFGLAKLLSRESGRTVDSGTGSQLTLDGMVMGTLPYLAPEQLQGLKIDGRADLFALGVMLYECLTGEAPFPSNSMVEYARALLIQDAPRPSAVRPETPAWLDELVMRLIDTHPERRPMSAAVVRMELEEHMTSYRDASGTTVTVLTPEPNQDKPPRNLPAALVTAVVVALVVIAGIGVAWRFGRPQDAPLRRVAGPPSVATLPLSSEGEAPPLALGLMVYFHRRLEMVPGLAVRDLGDVLRYRNVAAGFGAIGERLGADWVLSGEVLDAEPLRVRLVWVHSADELQLWSEDFDLSGDGGLAVQNAIFDRVLQGNDQLQVVSEPQPVTASRAALRSYLLALSRLRSPKPETAWAAFERSLGEDPDYFWALVDSARCVRLGECRPENPKQVVGDLLQRARGKQPNHPLMLLEEAELQAASGRPKVAAATVERLLAAHPSYLPALTLHADLLEQEGNASAARAALERALRFDPGAWRLHDRLGRMLVAEGDLQAAVHQLAEADRLSPDRVTIARTHRFQALRQLGRAQDIVDLQDKSPLRVDHPDFAHVLGWAHEALGNEALARGMFGLAVELDPDAPERWVELGRYYERVGREAFARASFNEARKIWLGRLDAATGAAKAEALGWYGFLEAKRGRCDQALRTLGEHAASAFETARQAQMAARTLTLCGRPQEAEEMIGEALRRGLSVHELERDGELGSLDSEP